MDKYSLEKLLGKGSYGTAHLATRKEDGVLCVIKDISLLGLSKKETEIAVQEAKLLLALRHPNIVACKEAFQKDNHLYIVLELCSEGDLSVALKKRQASLPEDTILDWFVQLCLGLKHIHERKIVHRDLKPQNIFMSSGGILKIGDFGVSRILSTTAAFANTLLGTPYYLSPEICSNKSYNQKTDIWSLGCVLYEMAALRKPFLANTQNALNVKIRAGQFPSMPAQYSKELKSLVGAMLQVNPSRRPTAAQLLQNPLVRSRIQKFLAETQREVAISMVPLAEPQQDPFHCGAPKDGLQRPGNALLQGLPVTGDVRPVELKLAECAGASEAGNGDSSDSPQGDALRQRVKAARHGQQQIANLRLAEQQRALEEEHRRIERERKAALEVRRRAQAKEASDIAAARLLAKKAALQKEMDEQAAHASVLKEKERQMLRAKSRMAIKKQKAAWAARNKQAWSQGSSGEMEAVVFVPPPRPPLPSKQLLSSPRQGSEGIGGVAPQEHLAPVNTSEAGKHGRRGSWPVVRACLPTAPAASHRSLFQPSPQAAGATGLGALPVLQALGLSGRPQQQVTRMPLRHEPATLDEWRLSQPCNNSAGKVRLTMWRENQEAAAVNKRACLEQDERAGDAAFNSRRGNVSKEDACLVVTEALPGRSCLVCAGQTLWMVEPCAQCSFPNFGVQGLARMDSIASVGSRDYALMIEDMASLSLEPLEVGTGPDILDYLGRGFSSSGTFTLADGREVDIGVDWSEPLDVKARAIRRALKRKLGPSVFTRVYEELVSLRAKSVGTSFQVAEAQAVNKLATFLSSADVAYVPLMEQLLIAEALLRNEHG